jgi:hypothetical protein
MTPILATPVLKNPTTEMELDRVIVYNFLTQASMLENRGFPCSTKERE